MKFRKIFSTIAILSTAVINLAAIDVEAKTSIDREVDKIMSQMSLEEKVGQLFFIGLDGTDFGMNEIDMIKNYKPSGIILFDRNCQSEEQVKKLTRDLQKTSKLPLFIAIDEEGGAVARAKNIIAPPPSQKEIADSKKTELAKDWAIKTSRRLKALGINLNFAPVLDVGYNNPRGRAYSDDPHIVNRFARAAIEGYREENFLFTLKHFPGIGRGTVDSHFELSDINAPLKEIEDNDAAPFRNVIARISPEKYMIMISHYKYSSIDANNPASVSKSIITELLREKYNYKGIVITDALEMGAISKNMSVGEAGVSAIEAGADIALICREYADEREVYNSILNAVKSGRISKNRVDESVRRILKAKISANIF